MSPSLSLLVLCLLCCVSGASAKICRSLDIRSHAGQFDKLKNCTRIAGFLKLVLLEDVTKYPAFPQLREITGYLMVFNVKFLYDLGEIFPNLVVIRGNILCKGNSLVIYHNDQINKIGLSNLRKIERGTVQIGKCPSLCYVHSVNWTALGTSLARYADIPKCEYEECAPDCKGQCWAPGKCQSRLDDNCHAECLGCTKPESAKHCLACKNFQDNDTCVNECPSDKYLSEELLTCITKEECEHSELPGDRWIFERRCVTSCPDKYRLVNTTNLLACELCSGVCTKVCPGAFLESIADIESFNGCTHIDGHLGIKIRNEFPIKYLKKNLGDIKEIDGCLTVSRSKAITSLDFLNNLQKIGGRNKEKQCNGYTVFIFDNVNLKKLFDVERIETYEDATIGFHDNPELCLSEIRQFASKIGITESNFENMLNQAKDVSPYSNGDRANCANLKLEVTIVENTPTNVTLEWNPYVKDKVEVIGYTVFYILATSSKKNLSYDMCGNKGWMSRFVSSARIQLTHLKPFSIYVYWIKVYHIKTGNLSGVVGSTEKRNFTTVPDDPTMPQSFETIAASSTSLNITWDHPEYTNGNLSYYHLLAFLEEDDSKFVNRRNYCNTPHIVEKPEKEEKKVKDPLKKWMNHTENGVCVCNPTVLKLDDTLCGPSGQRYSNEQCIKYNSYDVLDRRKRYLLEGIVKGTKMRTDQAFIDIKLPANETSFVLDNLKPFTLYIILFSACNHEFRGRPQCSEVLFSSRRTKANYSADKVADMSLKVVKQNGISLRWEDPPNPNGLIVAYNVEYKSADGSKSLYVPDCLTRNQHVQNGYVYKVYDLDPGFYTIRVRPVSLHGPGLFSRMIKFQIKSPVKTWVIYLFVFIVFVVLMGLILVYLWYKKTHSLKNIRLITSINPDYESASAYIEDSWEVPAEDVEVNNEIGQGSFGIVFCGRIKSRNIPCAVKTFNKTNKNVDKIDFLNEASVMKKFSEAHHVIKLLGVVSRGDLPLVIMELMERGDLKEYLRRSRGSGSSSQAISSVEMYLMAAQIADGMAYLASKKFVHRDLACRNCMVAADRTVKIGDFGMTKDIYETDYYRTGKNAVLPVRWMAPESLADGIYNSKTDAFSYGIVLWEIVTLAEQPYQGMANEQVLNFVISDGRMPRPPECPDVLWEIMKTCWCKRPSNRPDFTSIVERLEPLISRSFALVSFYHSADGRKYLLNYRKQELLETARKDAELFGRHSYGSEFDDALALDDQDFFSSANIRVMRRKSNDHGGRSSYSSYSISDQTP